MEPVLVRRKRNITRSLSFCWQIGSRFTVFNTITQGPQNSIGLESLNTKYSIRVPWVVFSMKNQTEQKVRLKFTENG